MQISPQPSHKVFVVALPLVAWCLQRLVQSGFPRYEAVGTSAALELAVSMMDRGAAHLVVVADGATKAGELDDFCRRAPVLLVTSASGPPCARTPGLGTARAVVPTTASPEAFFAALERVAEGHACTDDASQRAYPPRQRLEGAGRRVDVLTRREREVIAAIASDTRAQRKLLARRLRITEHTLRNHLTSVYSKLRITNRVALYSYAVKHGLTGPADADAQPLSDRDEHEQTADARGHGGMAEAAVPESSVR
jgi:two-component system, NarL family, nitrate/nitrite response regulator NarL